MLVLEECADDNTIRKAVKEFLTAKFLQAGGIADLSWDSNGRAAAENLISDIADNQGVKNQDFNIY